MSWFGDGLTSLKGQLSSFAKALTDETDGEGSAEAGETPTSRQDGEKRSEGEETGGERETEAAASGWTSVPLTVPPTGEELRPAVEDAAPDRSDEHIATSEDAPDVGAIIRGGIANLFKPKDSDSPSSSKVKSHKYTQTLSSGTENLGQDEAYQLLQQNEVLSAELARTSRVAAELQAQISSRQDENSNLSTGLQELDLQHQRDIANILVVRDETLREYESLKIKYQELEDEVEREREKRRVSEGKKEELMRELEERDHDVECLEGENSSLREAVSELKEEGRALAPITERDAEEVEDMQRQVEEASKGQREALTELEALRARLASTIGEREQLQATLDTLRTEMARREEERDAEEVEDMQRQMEEASKGQREALTELEALRARLASTHSEREQLQSTLDTLRTEMARREEETDADLTHLRSIIAQLEQQSDEPASETSEKARLEEKLSSVRSTISALESKLIESTNHIDHLKRECDVKDRKMCQILLESNAVEQECKNQLESEKAKFNDLLIKFNALQAENENVTDKLSLDQTDKTLMIENLKSDIVNLKQEILSYQSEKENLNKIILELNANLTALQKESQDLKSKFNEVSEKYSKQKESYENKKSECTKLKNSLENIKRDSNLQINQLNSQIDELNKLAQQHLINSEVFTQKEIELKNRLKCKEDEVEKLKFLESQVEAAANQKILLNDAEVQKIISEKDELTHKLSVTSKELEIMKSQLDIKEREMSDFERCKEDELISVQGKLSSVLKEKEELSEKLKISNDELETLLLKVQTVPDPEKLESERLVFLHKIESITEQNAKLLADIIKINSEHSSAKSELVSLHSREKADLEEKLSSNESKLNHLQEKYDLETKELNTRIKQVEAERTDLLNSIQMKHNECISYQTEVLRLNEVLKNEKCKLEALVVDKAQLEMRCEQIKVLEEQKTKYEDMDAKKSKELASLQQEVMNLKDQLGYASELLKETKRQEAEGQSEDSEAPIKYCPQGCAQTQEELNKLTWALHSEQANSKLLHRQTTELSEKLEKSESQLGRLQTHLWELQESRTQEAVEAQEAARVLRERLDQAEQRARSSSTAYTSASIRANQQVESLTQQVKFLLEQKEKLEGELSKAEDAALKQEAAVTNLQAVLHQFQMDKQKDINFETERLQQKLNDAYKTHEDLHKEIKHLNDQLAEAKKGLGAASRLSEQFDRKTEMIENLNSEVLVLKEKLQKAEAKVNEVNSSVEGKVDRSLVKNLVVGFVCAPERSRQQVLRVLGSVLDLSLEERRRLGLEPATAHQQQSLSEAFVKFLESESQPKPNLVLSVPATPEGPSRRTSQSSSSSILLSEALPSLPVFPLRSGSILKDVLKDNQ